ncbi:MAG: hypothetical protein ACI4K9_08055 [Candidatus Fimenecus sp.]
MKKTKQVCFYGSAVLLVCSFAAGIAELFGVSVCFFGTPLHQYLAIPICLFSVLFCIFACKRVSAETGETHGTLQNRLLRISCIVLCVLTVCITVAAAALTATQYTGQTISEDKAYKIFYETENEASEPIAHLYRRYSPFLMTYRNSAVLYGYADSVNAVETDWGDTYCTLSYYGYSEEAQSADDVQTLSRKLYYEPNNR